MATYCVAHLALCRADSSKLPNQYTSAVAQTNRTGTLLREKFFSPCCVIFILNATSDHLPLYDYQEWHLSTVLLFNKTFTFNLILRDSLLSIAYGRLQVWSIVHSLTVIHKDDFHIVWPGRRRCIQLSMNSYHKCLSICDQKYVKSKANPPSL